MRKVIECCGKNTVWYKDKTNGIMRKCGEYVLGCIHFCGECQEERKVKDANSQQDVQNNSSQDERARTLTGDSASTEVIFSASQSTSNKRDMGNPVNAFSIKEVKKDE